MKIKMNSKEDRKKKNAALAKDVRSKDWFEIILKEIEEREAIYSDPRLKGYVRENHESTIRFHIETYLAGKKEKKDEAYAHWAEIRLRGERTKIKRVENNMKSLENVLKKEKLLPKTKEKLINYTEEEINTQIPEEIREIYTEMISLMREKYL